MAPKFLPKTDYFAVVRNRSIGVKVVAKVQVLNQSADLLDVLEWIKAYLMLTFAKVGKDCPNFFDASTQRTEHSSVGVMSGICLVGKLDSVLERPDESDP